MYLYKPNRTSNCQKMIQTNQKKNLTNLLKERVFRIVFLRISSVLTGFSILELESTGMADLYYETVIRKLREQGKSRKSKQKIVLELYDYFLIVFSNEVTEDFEIALDQIPESIIKLIFAHPISKKIIKLWYTGSWYPEENNIYVHEVISAESYQEGLVWKVAQAHPPGAKHPGFASWSFKPFN